MKADNTILVAANMQLTDHGAKLSEAIPAAKAARSVQIESKIRPAVRYALAADIPPVQ